MPTDVLSDLFVVAVVAFLAPLLLGLAPRLRLPSVMLEIVAGIVIGPSVLGWVRLSTPLQVIALIGLALTLFLSGLEIDITRLRGRTLKVAGAGFAISFGLALGAGYLLESGGLTESALYLAIVLAATSLSVVIPVLKDAGQIESDFGQLLIVASSIAEFGTIILITLFFSTRETARTGTQVMLLGSLALLALVATLALTRVERSTRLSRALQRLQDTSAQIRVRGAILLLLTFGALAEQLGLEAILGTFIAGTMLTLIDRDVLQTHHEFRQKLDAIGFGFFIPFFFVVTGIQFDVDALFSSTSTVTRVPLFLLALLLVRGLPAVLYRPLVGDWPCAAAGILQATSLTFVVVAAQIGSELGEISAATESALIAAGLLSVLLCPLAALTILSRSPARDAQPVEEIVATPSI